MDLGIKVHYRRERGWSGKRYIVQISEEEYQAREKLKLIISIVVGTPLMIWLAAWVGGMI